MDRLGVVICVAALLYVVSCWLFYQLGAHAARGRTWLEATAINSGIIKRIAPKPVHDELEAVMAEQLAKD